VRAPSTQKEASGNHVQQVVEPAVRGSILDARGVPLADNETRLVVSASRTDLLKMKDDGKAVLTKLAGVLGLKPKDVIQKVRLCDAKTPQPCWNGSPYQPIPITDEATAKQALQIRERAEDFPGITAEPEAVRRYAAPGDANTAQVLGYLSPGHRRRDHQGQGHRLAVSALRPGRPLGPGARVRQGAARQGRRHPLRGRQPRPRHRQGQVR
jgi:cell division protein FtsI/penicillin-binding protein 2